ncbi:hypothetical protein IPA_02935 [Ignicoccus pacificus DSM 13166]|uniref:Uncharacterized protein n=1 Tax=Ignicoccus pacificus DSM 13166 TaxID=940294 RepID=A0A977KAT7_9CREN|nr:hypothetical protein IPA_02935 [Ignicoccus pacificus DSM 13166]
MRFEELRDEVPSTVITRIVENNQVLGMFPTETFHAVRIVEMMKEAPKVGLLMSQVPLTFYMRDIAFLRDRIIPVMLGEFDAGKFGEVDKQIFSQTYEVLERIGGRLHSVLEDLASRSEGGEVIEDMPKALDSLEKAVEDFKELVNDFPNCEEPMDLDLFEKYVSSYAVAFKEIFDRLQNTLEMWNIAYLNKDPGKLKEISEYMSRLNKLRTEVEATHVVKRNELLSLCMSKLKQEDVGPGKGVL